MNEQIKKLAQQATIHGNAEHYMDIPSWYLEKFAELMLTDVIGTIYRSDIGPRKQERLVQELAQKFGITE
jgi:hypothetical protein